MIKLLGASASPFVRKVWVTLMEKGLPFEYEPKMPGDPSPEFRAISPLGKIPGLTDGDFAISDSTAITTYLDAAYPQNPIYLSDPKDKARVVFFEKFADTQIIPAVGKIFFQRVASPRFFGGKTDESVVQAAIENEIPPLLDHLSRFIDGKTWLMGDRFTMADIACVTGFINAKYAGYEPDAARWPKVTDLISRALARPSFVKALEADKALFGG
jgi:glutathione S-transferase